MRKQLAVTVVSLLLLLTTAGSVFAQSTTSTTEEKTGTKINIEIPLPPLLGDSLVIDGSSIGNYLRIVFIYFIWIVGLLAVVMVIWGGIEWIYAAGNPARITGAREKVTNAIVGVILALTSVVILNTINPNLTNFRDFHLLSVDPDQLEEYQSKPERTDWDGSAILPYIGTIASRVRQHPDWVAAVQAQATSAVPAARIFTTIFIESSGNPNAKSSAGAIGLMQLLPSTAADYGYSASDLLDPIKNIAAGSAFLKSLAANTCPTDNKNCRLGKVCRNGDFEYIHAAYNGGRTANSCSGTCPGKTYAQCTANQGYAETRDYISKAKAVYQWIVTNNYPSN